MTAAAASVAVICAVALTNSVALSDAAGSTIDAAPVVVPASPDAGDEADEKTGDAGDDASPPAATVQPATDTRSTRVAEVVPAPAPEVVPAPTQTSSSPKATHSAHPTGTPTEDDAIAAAEASGSWDAARAWAERLGWSKARIDAWIDRLEKARGPLSEGRAPGGQGGQGDGGRGQGGQGGRDDGDRQGLVDSGDSLSQVGGAGREPGAGKGHNHNSKDRSAAAGSSNNRPAHAGANADHRSTKPGLGAKKDRSRDSPDRRD